MVTQKSTPIVDWIECEATRQGTVPELVWADIKSKAEQGHVLLQGRDENGRLCSVEPHWVIHIEPWGTDDPPPLAAPTRNGEIRATGGGSTSDMPRRETSGLIAFDRRKAIQLRRNDERDGHKPLSVPPVRLSKVMLLQGRHGVADGEAPKSRPGPVSTRDAIQKAAQPLINKRRIPGKTIPWQTFEVEICGVLKQPPGTRGYKIDTIQAAVRPLLLRLGQQSAESTEN
jgi:hypothetical protein